MSAHLVRLKMGLAILGRTISLSVAIIRIYLLSASLHFLIIKSQHPTLKEIQNRGFKRRFYIGIFHENDDSR
jgi:hypothetical protein